MGMCRAFSGCQHVAWAQSYRAAANCRPTAANPGRPACIVIPKMHPTGMERTPIVNYLVSNNRLVGTHVQHNTNVR